MSFDVERRLLRVPNGSIQFYGKLLQSGSAFPGCTHDVTEICVKVGYIIHMSEGDLVETACELELPSRRQGNLASGLSDGPDHVRAFPVSYEIHALHHPSRRFAHEI